MAAVCNPSPRLAGSTPRPNADFARMIHTHTGTAAEDGTHALRDALTAFAGRIAVVSSFGSQSAVLLALVAEIAPATPILFLDTWKLFGETLQYRQDLAASLGLLDVRDVRPEAAALRARDPDGTLHASDPDACCAVRKVAPLVQGLAPFDVWVTGRRRAQSSQREAMPLIEFAEGRLKINPLAHWDDAQVEAEMTQRGLPRHPLVAQGYTSIGCAPCTRPVAAGADPRSGRWAGSAKTECGIHRPH